MHVDLTSFMMYEGRSYKLSGPNWGMLFEDWYKGHEPKELFFRGLRDNVGLAVVNPAERKQVALGSTLHLYIDFIAQMDSWKNIPTRADSIIASTSRASAGGYGIVHTLYPCPDDFLACVSPTYDMWMSDTFPLLYPTFHLGSVSDMFSIVSIVIDVAGMDKSVNWNKQDLVELCKTITKDKYPVVWERFRLDEPKQARFTYDKSLKTVDVSGNSLFDVFEKIMDPETNGFVTMKSGNNTIEELFELASSRPDSEVWFGSKCLLKS